MNKMTETGVAKEEIDEFKKGAPAALKKITGNFSNYDCYIGESAEADGQGTCMYVLVDVSTNEYQKEGHLTDLV